MVHVFLARSDVVGIVHTNIPWRFATRATLFEVLTIAAFKDVHLREVNTRVVVVVHGTIPRTQVLCAKKDIVGGWE
jgi:hypothetical protein